MNSTKRQLPTAPESAMGFTLLEIVVAIQEGLNPRVVEEVLKSYLPSAQRVSEQAEAA